MDLNFDMPKVKSSIIKVMGVGGSGNNAVNHMYRQGINGVDFIVCNTDAQALEMSPITNKIQIGANMTEGRGAGSKPEVGKKAAHESIEEVKQMLDTETKMLFITAGMGGGTGTGAAPIVAQVAKEMGILTVGIVTTPFVFEGNSRDKRAKEGIKQLGENVDTLLVISNEKLRSMFGNLSLSNAFSHADDILATAAKGIAEIITVPGYINVDFEDVKTVMANSGKAIMGSAVAEGENRDKKAVENAIHSPLLSENDIKGAKYILLNITSGNKEVLMDEISTITDYIQDEAGQDVDMIWGNCVDESLGDKISVTIIATAFDKKPYPMNEVQPDEDEAKPEEIEDANQLVTRQENADEGVKTWELETDDESKNSSNEESSDDKRPYEHQEKPQQMELNLGEEESTNPQKQPNLISAQNRLKDEGQAEEKEDAEPNNQNSKQANNGNTDLNSSEELEEMEKVPAYVRKGVKFKPVPHSSEEADVSKYTLSDDSEGENNQSEIKKKNNSFLHDNVD